MSFGESASRKPKSGYGKPRPRKTVEEVRAKAEKRAEWFAGLPKNEQFQRGYVYGVEYLAEAPRTAKQIKDKLMKRNVPDDVADAVVERLAELGYVDDEDFAERWVASRQRSRGLAKSAIRRELITKGIDKETAEAATEDVSDEDEYERARALVVKKARSMKGVERQTATRRLVGMLARKGYPPSVAYAVVKDVLAMDPDEEPDFDD